ncbi:hypothetical protein D3C75_1218210 [compost metagenome]
MWFMPWINASSASGLAALSRSALLTSTWISWVPWMIRAGTFTLANAAAGSWRNNEIRYGWTDGRSTSCRGRGMFDAVRPALRVSSICITCSL